jgi:hypothetical protein
MLAGRRFDWIGWETRAVAEEIRWWLTREPVADSGQVEANLLSGKAEVLAFLDRQRQIADLENRIQTELARLPQPGPMSPFEQSPILPPSVEALERQLEILKRQQQAAEGRVERIMAAQVSQVLADEGLGSFRVGGLPLSQSGMLPPVAFRFNDLPTYLVISPRDEIRTYRGIYLVPDIPEPQRVQMEADIESRLDVSALVDDVGGVGSWPTMVIDDASLRSLFDIVAHEWTHTYLFFRPLGLHDDDSRDLTTMNETVASMIGGEVADLVLARFYPELIPPPVTSQPESAKGNAASREDFNQAMRRIRLHVDELLAKGRVVEAEDYMEQERQKLVAAGHRLRRLNQAYFAFHGSYATSPASVDPIGPWLRQLRAQSGSLKGFLDQVSRMRSLEDLLRAVGESGPDGP